jgi:hypothetical protein
MEALGWWAGWYGDEVATGRNNPVAPLSDEIQSNPGIFRYIVYVDGVGQSS